MSRLVVPPTTAGQITARQQTLLARPVDTRQPRLVRRTRVGASQAHLSKPYEPKTGRSVGVWTHRYGDTNPILVCHCEIVTATKQRHGDIGPAELHALGAKTLADHARQWLPTHDADWLWKATEDQRAPDDRLSTCARHLSDDQALERFDRRWSDRSVWLIGLSVIASPERFLARIGIGGDEHGHTLSETGALDAGTLVDPDDLSPRWTHAARIKRDAATDPRKAARELAKRLRAA